MIKFERIPKSPELIDFEKLNPMPPFDYINQAITDAERNYLQLLKDNGLRIEDYEPNIYWKDDMTIVIEAIPKLGPFTSR